MLQRDHGPMSSKPFPQGSQSQEMVVLIQSYINSKEPVFKHSNDVNSENSYNSYMFFIKGTTSQWKLSWSLPTI